MSKAKKNASFFTYLGNPSLQFRGSRAKHGMTMQECVIARRLTNAWSHHGGRFSQQSNPFSIEGCFTVSPVIVVSDLFCHFRNDTPDFVLAGTDPQSPLKPIIIIRRSRIQSGMTTLEDVIANLDPQSICPRIVCRFTEDSGSRPDNEGIALGFRQLPKNLIGYACLI